MRLGQHAIRIVRHVWLAVLAMTLPIAAASAQTLPPSGSVDLYIFAGQSNMRGHVATLSADAVGPKLIPSPYKEAFAAPVDWALQWNSGSVIPNAAVDASGNRFGTQFVPYRAGYDPMTKKTTNWGPEVAFLYNRHIHDSRPIYFIKYAIGGTALFYKPTTKNWNVLATGDLSLLNALEERVRRATDGLLAMGYTQVNLHLLWAQGESDGGAFGKVYVQNFADMRGRLKTRLERPNVSFDVQSMTLVANLGSKYARSAISIAATHANSQVVNEFSYPLSLFIADKVHLSEFGQVRHGEEMELLARTSPRFAVDNTATDVTHLAIRIPASAGLIAYLPTIADGSTGIEILGAVAGLAVDPLNGRLSIVDLPLVQPGVRIIDVRRHTAGSHVTSRLVLTFVN